jgi:dTDP-4-dehydrorhamnose reductase
LKKLVITGSNGLLGQKLVKLITGKNEYEVHALSRGENRLLDNQGYHYHEVDLLDETKLNDILSEINPEVIIHTAAMTNVDACELHREECERMNVDVVRNVVRFCEDHGVYLVHLSTDFIFDGKKGSVYKENDPPAPVNYYGMSKLRSEMIIDESEVAHAILRTILVYGVVDRNDRSNIVLWVKNALEKREEIRVVTDQLRMPTYAEDLAEACWLAVQRRATGVFNVSSNTLMSIYEIALAVADAFGLDKDLIKPVPTTALKLPAERPLRTGFDLNKSINEINLPSYSFADRLQVFKDQLYSKSGNR